MIYDVIVVGGGMAGLTATSYLAKEGKKVLLCEKQDYVGGLVNSFDYKGFKLEGGIRAIEDSGIVKPMLKQLGIELEFLPSVVSLGFEQDIMQVYNKESLIEYQTLLQKKFPENEKDIENIIKEIKKIMKYMDILYGLDNPAFVDIMKNKKYLFKTVLPWLFKFLLTMKKVENLKEPVDEYLQNFTSNQALIDMIGQHFFYKTPTFFALSYFSLYLDYEYPKGGTGTLPHSLEKFIVENNGEISFETEITYIDPENKILRDQNNKEYQYKQLIWASDTRYLYKHLDTTNMKDQKAKDAIHEKTQAVKEQFGGDSIFTLYLTLDKEPSYFKKISTGHFFYTPSLKGLGNLVEESRAIPTKSKEEINKWLEQYIKYNTFEIAIPCLRDPSLAPPGKTALIISMLFDYKAVKHIEQEGWYKEFKKRTEQSIIDALEASIYPDLSKYIIDAFSATPLTITRRTNSSHGAITGWGFDNNPQPAENRILHVSKANFTPIKDVYQAGQWSYSPSGMPIAILTGKLAADKVLKNQK